MAPVPALQDVFGVPPRVRDYSYVDRGGLDKRLRYALSTERHVIIHGDSKQGKTWLRQNVLAPDDCVDVQCQLDATPASVLTQVLGRLGIHAELKQTSKRDTEGSITASASGELGIKLVSRIKLGAKTSGKVGRTAQQESEPVGQAPSDLAWVASAILASGKRVVIEDFHYLDEPSRQEFAFLLKALGDYGVHPVIIGVWSQDHLLTYYNGDLGQRVADIHLVWAPEELDEVLKRASKVLNISMSPSLRQELVFDAYGNVGTLQALAEALCLEEGIFERQREPKYLTPGPALDRARVIIARGMEPRFQAFADAYVAGLRGVSGAEQPVLRAVIEAVCDRPDDELLTGVAADVIITCGAGTGLNRAGVVQLMGGVERFQYELQISPLVVTFNKHAQTVCLVDRRFLFYRRYGGPRWPWSEHDFLL